jgi:uncharacterized protein (DUF885 family)
MISFLRIGFILALAWSTAAYAAPSPEMKALGDDYVAFLRVQDPIRAGFRGDRNAARRWPDNSVAAVAERKRALENFRTRLIALEKTPLDAEDALNRDIIRARVDIALDSFAYDEERIPFITGEGFYNTPESVAFTTIIRNKDDAEGWIARTAAIPAYYDIEIANLERAVRTRFTQPKLVVDVAIANLEDAAAQSPEQSTLLLLPFRVRPATISEADWEKLKQRAVLAIRLVKLAQRKLAQYLRDRYLPAVRASVGIGGIDGGKAYYAYLARKHTTTNMTPEQIHRLGVAEVARIRRAMDATIKEAGFSGSFADFLAFLRTSPQFRAKSAEEYVMRAAEIEKRVDLMLPQYIGTLPRLTFGFRDKPPGLENSSGGYWVGSPELGVPGTVVIEFKHATQLALYELPAWVMHEGAPGHHTQIALSQERFDLPEFRRNDDITAYVEGWALYTEPLGHEMGIYRTPYEKFGQLSMEIWRACRLVIDPGLHYMGWTRDQARACLLENSALPPHRVDQEVDRYIGWPGQALAYKVGELKIWELRRRAEKRLGARFDIRKFHDFILLDGPMPLDLLERRLDGWMVAQQAR